MKLVTALLVGLLAVLVSADVYLHAPRGSNNRLNNEGREVNNANRLFDSQNNNRGGYNVGSMYYYESTVMPVQWTAQHSCGNANNKCEFILQYTCDDLLRDGTTTTTIPTNTANCANGDCDRDVQYGRQESYLDYQYCRFRSRNKGLFTGTQNLKNRDTAQYTRQNAAGTRYGYECPEERDYYPYWGPSVWRDIAVLTNDPQRCAAYQAESQNVKERFYCAVPASYWKAYPNPGSKIIPITEAECNAFTFKDPETTLNVTATWTRVAPHGIPAPVCRQNLFSRDNHLGNTVGAETLSYNWTLPAVPHERCAFRLRYNISTTDFDGFANATSVQTSGVDASLSGPEGGGGTAKVPIWTRFNVPQADSVARGYVLQNNPDVNFFGSLIPDSANKLKLQHNVNTAQFSRTFEDRSFRFSIRSREGAYPKDAVIHNVNVRGKRGNIVQTFPSVEYDFVPNRLTASLGEYVHFQWTGSDANPGNNDGQGRAGTDRSNVVGLAPRKYEKSGVVSHPATLGGLGTNYPKKIETAANSVNFLGWDASSLIQLATLASPGGQFGGDMDELDDAGTYFDLAPRILARAGVYNYMCTRNNNFSNRSQKGAIIVKTDQIQSQLIGWNGGDIVVPAKSKLSVPEGTFTSTQQLALTVSPSYTLAATGASVSDLASDIVYLSGSAVTGAAFDNKVKLEVTHTASPLADTYIARADSVDGPWERMSTSVGSTAASTWTDKPGVYVVKAPLRVGAIVGIVIGGLVLIAAGIFLIIYCKKKAAATITASYEAASV